MFAHIEASLQSNESNKRYCEQHGLVPATFYYWLKKYKEEQPEKYLADTSGGFIPINVEKDPAPDISFITSVWKKERLKFPSTIQQLVVCH